MHDSGMGKGGNFSGRPLSAYTTLKLNDLLNGLFETKLTHETFIWKLTRVHAHHFYTV